VIGGPDAFEKKVDEVSGTMQWRFGFITEAQKRAAWYWRFVEFGTKGYTPGQQRRAGFDKRGRQKFRKIRRFIPRRVAQPFLRPAIIEMQRRIEAQGWWRNMATKIGRGETQ
jgi:HK97 gp10 family phage protein